MEVVASPSFGFTGTKLTTFALDAHRTQPLPEVAVDVDELVRRIPGAEVAAPPAQHRIEVRDHLANVIMAPCSWSQLLHALSHPLHAALCRPSLKKVDAFALLRPDRTAQPLPQVTAKEVEALLAP